MMTDQQHNTTNTNTAKKQGKAPRKVVVQSSVPSSHPLKFLKMRQHQQAFLNWLTASDENPSLQFVR